MTPRAIDRQIEAGIHRALAGMTFVVLDSAQRHDCASANHRAFDFCFVIHGRHYD